MFLISHGTYRKLIYDTMHAYLNSGRNLDGIHFAMTFLETWQKKQHGNNLDYLKWYAKDKDVIVIGGGDTGCDCIGTSLRQVS